MTFERLGRGVAIARGEALEVLRELPSASLHSLVTDPPAGIDFMGKQWDCFRRAKNPKDVGRKSVFGRTSRTAPHSYGESDRARFVDAMTAIFSEAFRVLRPGAWGAVWALPRTSHWTTWALEDAGFEIRDVLAHVFSTGFPKSQRASIALDKRAGVRPIRVEAPTLGMAKNPQWNAIKRRLVMPPPTTPEAKRWAGWGTALKPAREDWILVRKPMVGTLARNLLEHEVGAIDVEGCRVAWAGARDRAKGRPAGRSTSKVANVGAQPDAGAGDDRTEFEPTQAEAGRWPPNLLLSHSEDCLPGACAVGCAVLELDRQAGALSSHNNPRGHVRRSGSLGYKHDAKGETLARAPNDRGGASRFFPVFYCSKASSKEKNAGCEGLPVKTPEEMTGRAEGSPGLVMVHEDGRPKANPRAGTSGAPRPNFHPTIKAVRLCRWLVRLVTPPGGIVLDPFMGSGSIGVGCVREGKGYVGIDRDVGPDGGEAGYFAIARARISHAARVAVVAVPQREGRARMGG